MRIRRIAGTADELNAHPEWVVCGNENMAGRWSEIFGNDHPVFLEIGCGRGRFIAESAYANPDINYVALEVCGEVIVSALKRVKGNFPPNLRFCWRNAQELLHTFAPEEVHTIYLNFSDPWPKQRHAKRRLTHQDFLTQYYKILPPGGKIIAKTDGRALFEFSLKELLLSGFRLENVDWNYAGGDPQTEYETRFRTLGQPIYRFIAVREPEGERNIMKYVNTRSKDTSIGSAAVIRKGLADNGGLFVPQTVPQFPYKWEELVMMDYQTLAQSILSLYLTDYDRHSIKNIVLASYNKENFDDPAIAPLVTLHDNVNILELWHGPTAAFKDMALQIMPRLLVEAVKIEGDNHEVDILVATSGDTGKAALEGFKNIDGIKVICFYPHGGVSRVQYLQMATTNGNNTDVVAVRGNFDNCQTGVKTIFGDENFAKRLAACDKEFSSANSINWGRLLPQIIYYFWAYAQLLQQKKLNCGDEFNVVVPTGNFGNILAAYYARLMGLPIKHLVCASNSNKVLADVLETGVYDRRREFYKTSSPSMDILVSSNFERFLYLMSNCDDELVAKAFTDLKNEGMFKVDSDIVARWKQVISGGYASDDEVNATIKRVYDEYHYTLDPHTAVAIKVYEDYVAENGDDVPVVVASTASPYKFPQTVISAITGEDEKIYASEQERLEHLAEISGMPIHRALSGLEQKEVLHNIVVDVDGMSDIVAELLHV